MQSLLLISAFLGASDPLDVSVREVERRAIAHRQSIRSGIVKITSRARWGSGARSQLAGKRKDLKVTVYFDGKRIRGDYQLPYDGSLNQAERYLETVSHTADAFRYYSDEEFADGGRMATYIKPPAHELAQEVYQVPDPRLIGMATDTFEGLENDKFNGIIGGRTRSGTDVSMQGDLRNGIECLVLTYPRDKGEFRVWLAPQRDYNPIAIEGDFQYSHPTEGKVMRRHVAVECELAMVDGFGWFPSHAHFRRTQDGRLLKEEHLDVQVVQFNRGLDEETFHFTGMGVPEGTLVHDERAEQPRQLLMTGSGLVAYQPDGLAQFEPDNALRNWLLIGSGVLFAGLALFLLWRTKLARGS